MPKIITPEIFKCPLTHQLMSYPAMTVDGNIYEWSAIEEWLETHDTNPITGSVLHHKQMEEALLIKEQIEKFKQDNEICQLEDFCNAIETGNLQEIKQLNYLDYHLNVLPENNYFEYRREGKSCCISPLHYATLERNLEVVQLLLDEGANPNIEDEWGLTPLDHALEYENMADKFDTDVIDLLIIRGADTRSAEIKDRGNGWNPLHYAVYYDFQNLVRLLIHAGVDSKCPRNRDGETLEEIAAKYNDDLVSLIPQYRQEHLAIMTAYQILAASRILLNAKDLGDFKSIPPDIIYHILAWIDNQKYLNPEQIKQVFNYAKNKKMLGQSKVQFSQQTLFFKPIKPVNEQLEINTDLLNDNTDQNSLNKKQRTS